MRRSGLLNRRGAEAALIGAVATAAAAAPVATPLTIMGANCVEWWRADLGNTIAADGNWVGQVLGTIFAQATSLLRPSQDASGGPNGKPMMTFDGVAQFMTATLVRAAPGTTPCVIWMIIRQESWAANDPICNDSSAGAFALLQTGSSPRASMSNGSTVNQNLALAVAAWGRLQAYYNNSAADELLLIATSATGASAGNNSGTAPRIGTNGTGTAYGNFSLTELAYFNLKPSAGQKTSLDSYVTDRYGAGLV